MTQNVFAAVVETNISQSTVQLMATPVLNKNLRKRQAQIPKGSSCD